MRLNPEFVILISANAEWQVVRKHFQQPDIKASPYGEWVSMTFDQYPSLDQPVVFMHGGWGKVAAAASTQYALSRWKPKMVVNLGTCGGFDGEIEKGEVILVENTLIYDIYEQMGDPDDHIKHYATKIDTTWLKEPLPLAVTRTLLVSGDRDLFCEEVPLLKSKYGAIAGDWESGAIAWVSTLNRTQCLILRGVTDLVGESGGEAYEGKVNTFYENTNLIMEKLLNSLPLWLVMYKNKS